MDETQAKAIAEEAAAKAVLLQGQQISQMVAKELSGEVLHHSPISPHCEAILTKAPECTDFRGIRSWVMCKAFALLEEGGRKKLPVGEAWAEARKVCREPSALRESPLERMEAQTRAVDEAKPSDLRGRQTRMGGFGDQVFSLKYAGWGDWWIVLDANGQEYGRFSGTEIIRSGLLVPA